MKNPIRMDDVGGTMGYPHLWNPPYVFYNVFIAIPEFTKTLQRQCFHCATEPHPAPAASLASTATDHQASSGASTAGSAPAAELRADLAGQLFCTSNSYSSYQAPPKQNK